METHVTFGQILPVMITLAVVGVLLILGAFLLWRRGRRQQARRAPPSGPGKRKAAPEPAAQRTPGLMTRIQDFFFYTEEEKAVMQAGKARQTAPPDAVEVMRIWRDVTDGTLIIQIGGRYFRTLQDIRDAGQERRFMAALRELAAMSRVAPAPEAASLPTEAAPAPEAASAPEEQPVAPAPVEEAPAPPPTPSPIEQPATAEEQSLGSFFDNVKRAVQSGGRIPKSALPGLLSIPEQIEVVLQARLLEAPDFAGRSIHIKEAAHGGVLIEVDGASYEAVVDITDDAVRAFVQDTIRDWETRS